MCENAAPRRLLQGGVWRWGRPPPRAALPACSPPPLAAQSPTHAAPASYASLACAPWPLWGSGRSQGSASHPARGETHSSLCHFPSWAAKGPGPPPPAPQEPPPSCPTDAPQMGVRQAAWAQPLPAPDFLQPPPPTGAFGEGSFQLVSAVLTP